MLKTKKVSDSKLKIRTNGSEKVNVKGADWFPLLYCNIFECAKKNSGKTTVTENILEHCSGPNTKFIFICSTIDKDSSWKRITDYWKKKGHDVIAYDDLYDEDGNDVIQLFMDSQKVDAKELESYKEKLKQNITELKAEPKTIRGKGRKRTILGGNDEQIIELKEELKELTKPKKKLAYPEYIIVLDDLGEIMRTKSVNQFVKFQRHYKTKVILSGQNVNDLQPQAIKQLDYVLAFGRIPDENVMKLKKDLLLDISDDLFMKLYKDATAEPHQFLYIGRDPKGDTFRKGFNNEYDLNGEH